MNLHRLLDAVEHAPDRARVLGACELRDVGVGDDEEIELGTQHPQHARERTARIAAAVDGVGRHVR
jgi:hypothetical protein